MLGFIKKYWYVLPLLLLLGGLGALFFYYGDVSPKELLRQYGYYVILIWTFLEGETIVIIAGILAPELNLHPGLIALCAFCGSFISDQFMFSLGKYKGKAVLHTFPRLEKNMDKAAGLFKKYDVALILGFRFIYGVRNVTPIMLGIGGVSHAKFFLLNIIGAGVWAASFSYGGYYAGKTFMKVMEHFGHGVLYLILAVLVAGAGIWLLRSRSAVKSVKEIASRPHHDDISPASNDGPLPADPAERPLSEDLPHSQDASEDADTARRHRD